MVWGAGVVTSEAGAFPQPWATLGKGYGCEMSVPSSSRSSGHEGDVHDRQQWLPVGGPPCAGPEAEAPNS